MELSIRRAQAIASQTALLQLNTVTERYGLTLKETDIARLNETRFQALSDSGRMEFGAGVLPKIVYAFCDSPYLTRDTYVETLSALTAAFYHFKGEAMERLSDDELVAAMKDAFDGPCQGSMELLSGTALENLCGGLRGCERN